MPQMVTSFRYAEPIPHSRKAIEPTLDLSIARPLRSTFEFLSSSSSAKSTDKSSPRNSDAREDKEEAGDQKQSKQ